VVSEITVTAAPGDQPGQARPVVLQNAQADFSQGGYDVKTAIDGKALAQNNGWAISPETGKDHTALFETRDDTGIPGGTRLTFVLNQQYADGTHSLGRFRLSVTTDPRPHRSGLAADIAAIIATPPAERNAEQIKALTAYFRTVDPELHALQARLAEARSPVPEPDTVRTAREALDKLLALPPVSPRLANLESDVALSAAQAADPRLTAAQDLAWALINSPAFLFNY
jgi:hypothetical protein